MANRKERPRKRMQQGRPSKPGETADLAAHAGQGDPDLDLPVQVRGEVNSTTIETLAGLAEEETERLKRHKRK